MRVQEALDSNRSAVLDHGRDNRSDAARRERPRVLVIPSWYPTKDNLISGSFFQEQSAVLEGEFDVQVLFGVLQIRPRHGRVSGPIRGSRADDVVIENSTGDTYPEPPPVNGFSYSHYSCSEEEADERMIAAYGSMLERLMSRGWRPDLLHAHNADAAGIVATALSRRFGIPWVLTEHTAFLLHTSEYRRRRMIEALSEATTLLAVSYYQMRSLLIHEVRRPIQVVGNLIDDTIFTRATGSERTGKFRILTVTHEDWVKDAATFFTAISRLVASGHKDIEAVIIGNTHYGDASRASSAALEQLASQAGVRAYCRFVAFAPRAAMPSYYAECDVCVSTSIVETFGIAPREAMAAGKPVVSTANGGVDDILSPANGVRVQIRDAAGIADALEAIKTRTIRFDPDEIRQTVVERYGRATFLRQLGRIYRETISCELLNR